MIDQEEIRINFLIKKHDENLSLGDVAKETGVSRSTLSRFCRGVGAMDVDNLIRIAAFCGITNLSEGIEADGNTIENVKDAIRFDANLTREGKIKLWRLFNVMYRTLAKT